MAVGGILTVASSTDGSIEFDFSLVAVYFSPMRTFKPSKRIVAYIGVTAIVALATASAVTLIESNHQESVSNYSVQLEELQSEVSGAEDVVTDLETEHGELEKLKAEQTESVASREGFLQ